MSNGKTSFLMTFLTSQPSHNVLTLTKIYQQAVANVGVTSIFCVCWIPMVSR